MTKTIAAEAKNNSGRYLKMAEEGEEIVITKNGIEVAPLISKEQRFLSCRTLL